MRITTNLIAAAMAGISMGALGCANSEPAAQSPAGAATTDISQKHGCKGQNACKGKGFVMSSTEKDCTDAGGKVEK